MNPDELRRRHAAVLPEWIALYYERPMELVRGEGFRFGYLDKIIDHFRADSNSHAGQDVRHTLAPLAQLARRCELGIWFTTHPSYASAGARGIREGGSVQFGNVDYTPYEGMTLDGGPVSVYVRGNLVYKDGEILGEHGSGRFVERIFTATRGLEAKV